MQMQYEKCIIGIGGGAGNFINSNTNTSYRLIAINRDKLALENVKSDIKLSSEYAIKSYLAESIKNYKSIYIVITLGGYSNHDLILFTLEELKQYEINPIIITTLPFRFEEQHKHDIADKLLREIKLYAHELIILNNQEFLENAPKKSANKIFFNIDNQIFLEIKKRSCKQTLFQRIKSYICDTLRYQ